MNKIIVQPGQSMLDIALQYLGGVDTGLEHLAQVNGLQYDSPLVPGQELEYDPAQVENLEVVRHYAVVREGKVVATVDVADLEDAESLTGVGYDIIEDTLIVYE